MPDTISFFARHDPALEAGAYRLAVEQRVTNDPHGIHEQPSSTTTFAVAGPRFALDATAVAGRFPPPNTEGDYAATLAQVALDRLTLPWERTAGAGAPWLAVLVLDDDEVVSAADAQVGDLQRAPFAFDPEHPSSSRASLLPAATRSYADADPDWRMEPGQSLADRCRVIDVPVELFTDVAPALDELPWLAHTREHEGASLSYVVANRTPSRTTGSTAHLVSLEQLAPFLPAAGGKAASALAGASHVRLVTLASWSFRAAGMTFAERLSTIDCGALRLPDPSSGAGPALDTAQRAVRLGYCPLAHRTRAGDATLAWYRGPFVPGAVLDGIADPAEPVADADALLRYDPETAIFDISYAAAWQLGRLLAMADAEFARRLRAWKASLSERTALAQEHRALDERIGAPAAGGALKAVLSVLPERAGAALDAGPASAEPAGAPPATGLQDRLEAAAPTVPDELPGPLADWLGDLAWLRGAPLRYLVPDERLTRSPSIRFFRVDPHWTRALVDGAFSLARTSSWQAAHDAAAASALRAATGPPASGLLLRSPVVDDYAALTVIAHDAAGAPLHATVRPLAPGILLCLFDGVAASVEIHEAPTALHLALASTVAPRGADGGPLDGADPVATPWRAGRVVAVDTLAGELATASGQAPFTSAELALQLAVQGEAVGYSVKEAP